MSRAGPCLPLACKKNGRPEPALPILYLPFAIEHIEADKRVERPRLDQLHCRVDVGREVAIMVVKRGVLADQLPCLFNLGR